MQRGEVRELRNARRFQRPCGGFMEDNCLFLSGAVFLPVPCLAVCVIDGLGTLPNKPFSTDAPQRGRGKIRKWVPASYACYECFYPLGSYPLLRRKSDFAKLPQKKNAAISKKITTLSKSCSVLSRTFLFALFFDFGNLFCRCAHNPYARIAHAVKERVKLPPFCVLCGGRV